MDAYKDILTRAINANKKREFYSQYPEHHKAYPEPWLEIGKEAHASNLNGYFKGLEFGKNVDWIGEEVSPVNLKPLGIKYPAHDSKNLIRNALSVKTELKNVPIETRAQVLIDALERIKIRFFEIAFATIHTTGQSFMMAFQASGPHASDRALEAIATAYQELTRYNSDVSWEKPMGKSSITLKKEFKPIPKGVALAIGCSTFPVWNSVPAIFANIMCGNPVIAKPHPSAILPIAIVVSEIQNALNAARISRKVVQLAIDTSNNPITKKLAENANIKVIDYTGGNEFGNYIESLKGKTIFTEKSAINSVILDSVNELPAVIDNLAFAAVLYSGQMCTSPQNIFISEKGVKTKERVVGYSEVIEMFLQSVKQIIENPKIGPGTLASIQNENCFSRVKGVYHSGAKVLLEPSKGERGRTCTPLIVELKNSNKELITTEHFGPIVKIIKTVSLDDSLSIAKNNAEQNGAITCLVHCTDPNLKTKIKSEMEEVFTPVSFNLTGYFWVNQHAAFSDFHVTGGNAAGNASFTDANFVNQRFVWVGHREMV